jgi:peroxin-12
VEHTASGYPLDDELAFDAVSAFLTRPSTNAEGGAAAASLSEFEIESALRTLDFLSLRGTDVLNIKVFNMLYGALILGETASADHVEGEQRKIQANGATRMRTIMDVSHLPWDTEMVRVNMELRFQNDDFEGFWKLWNSIPFHEGSRTQKDYEVLFRLHAESSDPVRTRECLSTWVPMMEREEPKVRLQGDVVPYIAACLRLSGSSAPTELDEFGDSPTMKLWKWCMYELEKPREQDKGVSLENL